MGWMILLFAVLTACIPDVQGPVTRIEQQLSDLHEDIEKACVLEESEASLRVICLDGRWLTCIFAGTSPAPTWYCETSANRGGE